MLQKEIKNTEDTQCFGSKKYDNSCYTQIADRLKHMQTITLVSYLHILQQQLFTLGKAPEDKQHCQKVWQGRDKYESGRLGWM